MLKVIIYCFLFLVAFSVYGQSGADVNHQNTSVVPLIPLVVGHRGGFDSKLPENSIPRFDFTYEKACSKPIGIEFDIRESASGSLYIMHDSTVDRTTNGNGKIALLTDSYINSLSLKDAYGSPTAEKIPLFSDVLLHFRDKEIMLMLDVKGKIFPKVIRMVEDMKMESKCILLTFNANDTKLVKETTDKILISALVMNKTYWDSLLKLEIPARQLIAYVSEITTPSELLDEIIKSNVLVMTDISERINNHYNRYDPDYYRHFQARMKLGIVISDYPVYVNSLFCKD